MEKIFETYRGFVYPWEMDHIGHMNVRFYVGKFDEASWHFLAGLGITPNYLRKNQRGMVAAEQHIFYRKEVLSGDLIVIRSILDEIRAKTMRYRHIMYNAETNQEIAVMELIVIHTNTRLRKSCEFPDLIYQKGLERLKGYEQNCFPGSRTGWEIEGNISKF